MWYAPKFHLIFKLTFFVDRIDIKESFYFLTIHLEFYQISDCQVMIPSTGSE